MDLLKATPMLESGKSLIRLKFGLRLSRYELNDLEELEIALGLPASLTVEIGRP